MDAAAVKKQTWSLTVPAGWNLRSPEKSVRSQDGEMPWSSGYGWGDEREEREKTKLAIPVAL